MAIMTVLALFVPLGSAVEGGPVEDLLECAGVYWLVGFDTAPPIAEPLPGRPNEGLVLDDRHGNVGLFILDDDQNAVNLDSRSDLIWYRMFGRTTTYTECPGVGLQAETSVPQDDLMEIAIATYNDMVGGDHDSNQTDDGQKGG